MPLKIKETDERRKPGGDTFHVISSTFHGRLKLKGYQFQVQLGIKCDTFESHLQLNNYASERGLETLMDLCALCMFQRY